jgi:hypothetical protein
MKDFDSRYPLDTESCVITKFIARQFISGYTIFSTDIPLCSVMSLKWLYRVFLSAGTNKTLYFIIFTYTIIITTFVDLRWSSSGAR